MSDELTALSFVMYRNAVALKLEGERLYREAMAREDNAINLMRDAKQIYREAVAIEKSARRKSKAAIVISIITLSLVIISCFL